MKTVCLFWLCLIIGVCSPCRAIEYAETEDENMTVLLNVDSVMNAYITAIGGWEKVKAIKDMTIIHRMQVNGKEVIRKTSQINAPEGTFFVLSALEDGEEKYKSIIEKNKLSVTTGSSRNIIEGERATQIYNQTFLMIEPAYEQIGVKPELEGVQKINGRYAFKVKAMFGNQPIYSFYDCETGLKVEVLVPTPKGISVSYIEDYREIGPGVLYSFSMRNKDQVNTIHKIEVNQGLKMEDFQ